MRTVNIGELRDQLSGYLQQVRNGEEIVVRDRNIPVARIVPFRDQSPSSKEQQLAASGAMRLPEQDIDWKAFFSTPAPDVAHDVAVQALIDSRGDR